MSVLRTYACVTPATLGATPMRDPQKLGRSPNIHFQCQVWLVGPHWLSRAKCANFAQSPCSQIGEPIRLERGRRAATPIPAREFPLGGGGDSMGRTCTKICRMGLSRTKFSKSARPPPTGAADQRVPQFLENERSGGTGPALGAPSERGQ